MKFRFLLFILLFLSHFSFAQEEKETVIEEVVIEADTLAETVDDEIVSHYMNMAPADSILAVDSITHNTVYPKTFDKSFQSKYKPPDFDYTTTKPKESFLKKLFRKIGQWLDSVLGTSISATNSFTEVILKLLGILLIAFLAYLLIRYLVGKDGNFFFTKRNKKLNIDDANLHENIHEINFPTTISQFESQKDFRNAVRYRFLFTLKKLNDKQLIEWNPEKTNKDYVKELSKTAHNKDFGRLSTIFDYVWYGEFDINESDYQYFRSTFENFKV